MKEKTISIINQSEISSYLKDVRKLKVMNAERERELAKIMLNPDSTKREKDLVKKELDEKTAQNKGFMKIMELLGKRNG
jgi:uncharacterized protein YjiK